MLEESEAILGLGGVDMWPISYFTGAIFSILLLNLLYVYRLSSISNMHTLSMREDPDCGTIDLLSISC